MTGNAKESLEGLIREFRFDEPVYVAKPTLPELDDFKSRLESVWESSWLTNEGALHNELRGKLCGYLGVEHLSLCCNGTVALLIAIQAAGIDGGEIITTPFTFPATPHALHWNRVQPVFCDIEERNFTLDPERIEAQITRETRGILPVHVFGYPCDVEAIQQIADRYGLPVIYDAAHMTGVRYRGESILRWGDYSTLSFHATKLFTTAEGGAIISSSDASRRQVDFLKNFGIANEETVVGLGINGKMNELQSALGLLQLEMIDAEIANRKNLTSAYRRHLDEVPGISYQSEIAEHENNYSYFTIIVDGEVYGLSRDELWEALRRFNVVARKYFSPLASHYLPYSTYPSARAENLPVAERVEKSILCLPLYGTLEEETVEVICRLIAALRDHR